MIQEFAFSVIPREGVEVIRGWLEPYEEDVPREYPSEMEEISRDKPWERRVKKNIHASLCSALWAKTSFAPTNSTTTGVTVVGADLVSAQVQEGE